MKKGADEFSGFLALDRVVWFHSSHPSCLLSPLTRRYEKVIMSIILLRGGLNLHSYCQKGFYLVYFQKR